MFRSYITVNKKCVECVVKLNIKKKNVRPSDRFSYEQTGGMRLFMRVVKTDVKSTYCLV